MTDTAPALAPPPPELDRQLAALTPCEIVVGLPTYNNAATVPVIVAAVRAGLAAHFTGASAALVNVDAGSTDRTPELLAEAGMPCVLARHEAPSVERAAVPFHGVPGRDAALRSLFDVARRLQARVLVLLEADVTSVTEEWIERLVRAVWEAKADLVTPAYVRHRYAAAATRQAGGLWRGVAGSEPVSAVGDHARPSAPPATVGVDRMLGAFRRGLRALIELWELVLAPEALDGVLDLDARDVGAYRFPDRLWARVVFDFALGHRYGVVHREHLLRSLVPLYLGRTAAFVAATQASDGAETEAVLERVGAAFEAEKLYLTERWR